MGMVADNAEDYGKEAVAEKQETAKEKITLEKAWHYVSNHMISDRAFDCDDPELAHDAYDMIAALVKNAMQEEKKEE
jgi:hypothetical protein